MPVHLTIDKAGRVVIPKSVRERLGLHAGAQLEIEEAGEQIALRPVRATGPLAKEHGVWVWRTGTPLTADTTDAVLDQVRGEREAEARRLKP